MPMLEPRPYEVEATYTVTHRVTIHARTPEEAESNYESDYAESFKESLGPEAEAELDITEAMPTEDE